MPPSTVTDCLDACDMLLVMSVMPGFGGQAFDSVALEKLRQAREQLGPDVLLQVDGGVNQETISSCGEAGANLFVVGSAIFRSQDYAQSVAALTRLAETTSPRQSNPCSESS